MKPKYRKKSLVLFALGVLCSCLIMEAGFRVIRATPLWQILPVIEPILGQPDLQTGYAFTPGAHGIWIKENRATVSINQLGLRDEDMTREKRPSIFRIGFVGDSYIEALQVEQKDTFEALTENELRQRGHQVEIANLAMSGNGPLRQLVRLETMGSSLNLDLVVSITSVSDFQSGELLDDSQHPGYIRTSDGALVRGHAFRERRAIRWMSTDAGHMMLSALQNSDVLRLFYWRSRDPVPVLLGLPQKYESQKSEYSAPSETCYESELNRLLQFWKKHEPEKDWQAASKVLDEYAAYAKKHKIPVMIMIRDIANPPVQCQAQIIKRKELVTIMRGEFVKRGLGFTDLIPLLSVSYAASHEGHFTPAKISGFGLDRGRGGHLNHEGHQMYARVMTDILGMYLRTKR